MNKPLSKLSLNCLFGWFRAENYPKILSKATNKNFFSIAFFLCIIAKKDFLLIEGESKEEKFYPNLFEIVRERLNLIALSMKDIFIGRRRKKFSPNIDLNKFQKMFGNQTSSKVEDSANTKLLFLVKSWKMF